MTSVVETAASPRQPRVGIFGLTGCAGDQLQILNCEDQLLQLAERMEIVDWVMVKSNSDRSSPLDIAFVEGVLATRRDLEMLRQVRARAADQLRERIRLEVLAASECEYS